MLFIVADDLNCAIGPYSDSVAKTPNIDRIAARGLTFERAYCQQAVCNPSRSSFLTGLRPNTVEVDDLRKSFRETASNGSTLITFPQHFKNHGYFCQDIGKLFHNMGEAQDRRSWSIDEVLFKGTHADTTIKNAAFTQHQQPFYGSRKNWKAWGYSVRTDRWRYTEWRSIDENSINASELYDHEHDPLETRNLTSDAGHREMIAALSRQLATVFPGRNADLEP